MKTSEKIALEMRKKLEKELNQGMPQGWTPSERDEMLDAFIQDSFERLTRCYADCVLEAPKQRMSDWDAHHTLLIALGRFTAHALRALAEAYGEPKGTTTIDLFRFAMLPVMYEDEVQDNN